MTWLLVVLVAIPCSTASGSTTCPQGYTAMNESGKCVKYFDEMLTWYEAEAVCQASNGHLVTISSEAEDVAVLSLFPNDVEEDLLLLGDLPVKENLHHLDVWIGLTDAGQEKTFQWMDGSPFTYSRWADFEPDNACLTCGETAKSDCVGLQAVLYFKEWGWSDKPCSMLARFVCQTDPVSETRGTVFLYQQGRNPAAEVSSKKKLDCALMCARDIHCLCFWLADDGTCRNRDTCDLLEDIGHWKRST